ncbi:phage/plasmid replication protein [Methylomonas sp. SURF-2]|uniref:Phage/plasmid replication protein n=1 Tax=Methylomonas subterranea TaxID=2952225 RepID=A0ABT1TIW0_9GAMM|nr:phage/plasmid replication protein [Methylomonas sp. SURF-2]MCQ8104689.1 phage/plasmid replication protein [Methylomonas sp. SURF-2]
MFYDWLSCYQDYDFDLPIISESGWCFIDYTAPDDEQIKSPRQNKHQHEGSYSTSIQIHVKGRRLCVSGNPSRFNRLDNLFGLDTVDKCVGVYNTILQSLGLPMLTKCTRLGLMEVKQESGAIKFVPVVDGCIITTFHITTNIAVGAGTCIDTYIRAVSGLSYLNRRGRLHPDGKTADWLSNMGNAREMYPSIYDKANEMINGRGCTLARVKKKYGEHSEEYRYYHDLYQYCKEMGVARFEQKLNSPYLKKHNLQYFGLSDYSILNQLHSEFLNLDEKLKVNDMELETISQTLLSQHIVDNTKAANLTTLYAYQWMQGTKFDLSKSQVKVHRARLRKIGIDIAKPCNLHTFSPVVIKKVTEIEKRELQPPAFYKHPNHLRLVA